MTKTVESLIKIKEIEDKLFFCHDKWNNEDYISGLELCEKVKLSKKIDSLNFEYSVFLSEK